MSWTNSFGGTIAETNDASGSGTYRQPFEVTRPLRGRRFGECAVCTKPRAERNGHRWTEQTEKRLRGHLGPLRS